MVKGRKSVHSKKLIELLNHGMDSDLHWFPEDVSPSRLAETMAGMANSGGGKIFIGIAPRSNKIQGVQEIEKSIDLVFQASILIDPLLVSPLPTPHQEGENQVLEVIIPQGLPHVYSVDGRYLGREGRHTTPLSAHHLRRILLQRGVVHFETTSPPDATFDDLDPQQVDAYIKTLNIFQRNTQEEALLQRGCLKIENGITKPTYAALLLFGHHPQQWLPNATILAARFSSSTISDEFIKQEIRGTLPQQIRQAEQFIRDHLKKMIRVVGLTHQETPEYPYEAVRELVVNAVAHRDYNIQGDNIHIHMFPDRLELHSPGGLPGPVNLKNLLQARFSRNAVIVQILSDLGFVERLGYGLDRVVASMKQSNLRVPHFEEVAGSFRVTLHGPKKADENLSEVTRYQTMELNPRQETALDYLSTHARITNRAYQELCNDVHPETLRRDLADLVKRGILLKIGSKRATYYILKTPK